MLVSKITDSDGNVFQITENYFLYSDTASTFNVYTEEMNVENILEKLNIKDIEKYLRKKKIQNLTKEDLEN